INVQSAATAVSSIHDRSRHPPSRARTPEDEYSAFQEERESHGTIRVGWTAVQGAILKLECLSPCPRPFLRDSNRVLLTPRTVTRDEDERLSVQAEEPTPSAHPEGALAILVDALHAPRVEPA